MTAFIVGTLLFSAIALLIISFVSSRPSADDRVTKEWLASHGYSEGQRPRDL